VTDAPLRMLLTAGPTHEPIDAVRYLGNRSSGRLGIALAQAAAERGHTVTLLLGPTGQQLVHSSVRLERFRTADDLARLLEAHQRDCDVLVMAAAVADYRPASHEADLTAKRRREPGKLTLELESTPDLLAACAQRRSRGQCLVGFALEPRATMVETAREKLIRKGIDLIIANPLETMDAETIEAVLIGRPGTGFEEPRGPGHPVAKHAFAEWLLDAVAETYPRCAP